MWKLKLGLLVAGSTFFLCWAVVLAATTRTLDVYIHDKYVVISPGHLLLVAALLSSATFAVWKAKGRV
jgi:hypothetical protein